jgi:hypothetical protein
MMVQDNWYSDKLKKYWNNDFNRVFTVLKLGVVGLDVYAVHAFVQ